MKMIIKKLIFIVALVLLVFSLLSCGVEPKEVDVNNITLGEQRLNSQCLEDSTYYAVRYDESGNVFIINPKTKLTVYQIKNYDTGLTILIVFAIFIIILFFSLGIVMSND